MTIFISVYVLGHTQLLLVCFCFLLLYVSCCWLVVCLLDHTHIIYYYYLFFLLFVSFVRLFVVVGYCLYVCFCLRLKHVVLGTHFSTWAGCLDQ